jgi:lipid-binding SYLF domain-containing protein
MNRKILAIVSIFMLAPALFAQKKEAQRLDRAAKAFQEIVLSDKGLPRHILDLAYCVTIFPSVKKVAFGIGDSYGRGALVCRKGPDMKGEWGAPVMFALDQGSLGLQLGTTATDFVLVVVSPNGVEQVLNGKIKLGTGANAVAGPSGAEASTYSVTTSKADVLTYSRSKGVFAGVSLAGALMEVDVDANTNLYGKELTAKEIVKSDLEVPDAASPLVHLLDTVSYGRR